MRQVRLSYEAAAAGANGNQAAVSGRPVTRLDTLVKARPARGDHPNVMVLTLGTNPSPGWHRDDYERVVNTIPDGVAVVLVTVYRSNKSWLPATARTMHHYSRAMRRVAGVRANVCTAPWRGRGGPLVEERGAILFLT